MRPSRATAAALTALITLAVALVVLATLQYRWIGLLATADARRMRSNIEFAANQFVNQVDHDLLTRTYIAFGEPASSAEILVRRYQMWSDGYRGPKIIRAIYFVAPGSTELQRLDIERRAFVPAPWPAALSPVRERVATLEPSQIERIPAVFPQSLFVIVPCSSAPLAMRPEEMAAMHQLHRAMACPALTIVEFDRARFLQTFLPELTTHAFGNPNGGDYELAIADRDTGDVLYRSDRWPEGKNFQADVAVPIFQLNVPHLPGSGIPLIPRRSGSWQLFVRYRDGSMSGIVAAAHRRNLGVALAVLVVLAGSASTLVVMLRRAQRLQQQELLFVAGVTHELNTPLAAINSAAQNLADGIIADGDEVARYGNLILKEGRRLTDMIAQVLDYAGVQARAPRAQEDVALAALISDAVEQCSWMLSGKPIRIEVNAAASLPLVRGDAAALTRAIQNLIANAIRHGGDGGWVRVSATSAGSKIEITVEDGGPGIRPSDLPHLFEPFYRGEGAGRVRGSGLGLTIVRQIVKAHGGEVTVDNNRTRGAAFTIVLPAIPAPVPMHGMAGEHA